MTHLGRPTEGEFHPEDDVAPVAAHLGSLLGKDVKVLNDWRENKPVLNAGDVVMLQNVRINKGEKKNDLELEKEVSSIVSIIEDKKGQDIKVYDMRGKSPFFDYSILCTGSSSRNIEAIATDIKKSLENVKSVEGLDEANWVLIDAGDLIISVFSKDAREYYRLDDFYNGVNEKDREIVKNDGE